MKIAIAQISVELGAVQRNLEKIEQFVKQASEKGADLILFPEMVETGYHLPIIKDHASSLSDAPFQKVCGMAKNYGIAIVIGMSEREGELIYNSQLAIDAEGNLMGKYRKCHLANYQPLVEGTVFEAGNEFPLFEWQDITVGQMICYDIRFPEFARQLRYKGADLILISAAWPFPRVNHWDILTETRAIENQLFVAAANRAGSDAGVVFCGSSKIVDPYGVVLTSAANTGEFLIYQDIDVDRLKEVREKMPVIEHVRRDLY